MKTMLALSALALGLAACSTHERSDNGRAANPPPTRLATASALGTAAAGSNLAGAQIVVDLETAPDARTSWGITACQSVLAPDFVLGQATCASGGSLTMPITAANARQVCSGDPKFGPGVGPSVALEIPGCAELVLTISDFAPSLAVSLARP